MSEANPTTTAYDSAQDTRAHIQQVRNNIADVSLMLHVRAMCHDDSKLVDPEKATFDRVTPLLRGLTYGSDEYKAMLAEMKPALDHHYAHNSHHPEHYPNGVNGMSLLDLVEMFCDWRAATMRHADGDFTKSLQINRERFGMSDQLAEIFENTRKELDW